MFAMSSTKQDRLIGETRPAERLTSPRALFVEGSVSCFPATRGHMLESERGAETLRQLLVGVQ